MATLGKAFGILMEFAVGILVFIGIGWLLDAWLGTSPWLVLSGVVVGFGGGIYRMVRQVNVLSSHAGSGGDPGHPGNEGSGGAGA